MHVRNRVNSSSPATAPRVKRVRFEPEDANGDTWHNRTIYEREEPGEDTCSKESMRATRE